MKMFKKPKWLKPELNEPKYWLHLLILAVVVLGLLQLAFGGEMLNIKNVITSIPLLAIGDTVAHTLLRMD